MTSVTLGDRGVSMRRDKKNREQGSRQHGLIFTQLPRSHGNNHPFQMPPNVTVSKQVLQEGGWAYVFRHKTLGELGRILVQDRSPGQCQISCEVAGDPDDPMTEVRAGIFKPLGMKLSDLLEAQVGSVPESERLTPPPASPPGLGVGVEGQLRQCERCGASVAMLVFAPSATDPARFEDYARPMYPEFMRLNVPTWIIGPALGGGPLIDQPADILQVWPKRSVIERLRPDEFNARVNLLTKTHCTN